MDGYIEMYWFGSNYSIEVTGTNIGWCIDFEVIGTSIEHYVELVVYIYIYIYIYIYWLYNREVTSKELLYRTKTKMGC